MMANPNRAGIAWGDARGGESGPRHLLPDSKWLVLHVVLGSFRLPSSLPRSSLPPREHPCRFVANPSPSRVPDSLVKLCLLLLPRPPPGPATHPPSIHFPVTTPLFRSISTTHLQQTTTTTTATATITTTLATPPLFWPALGLIPLPIKSPTSTFVCPFRLFVFSTSSSSVAPLPSTSGHPSSSVAAGVRSTPILSDLTKRNFGSKRPLKSNKTNRLRRAAVHQHTPFTETATELDARSLRSLPAAYHAPLGDGVTPPRTLGQDEGR